MSTEGLVGFRFDDTLLGAYSQCDSYPAEAGRQVVKFVAGFLRTAEQVVAFKAKVKALVLVEDDQKPDPESVKHYLPMAIAKGRVYGPSTINTLGRDLMVDEWYALLRDFHGAACLSAIHAGAMRHLIDWAEFLENEDCSYAYVLDLDAQVLEFWRDGSQMDTVPFAEAGMDALNSAYGLEGDEAVKETTKKNTRSVNAA